MKATGPWVVAKTEIKSSQHGGEYVDITLINVDGEIAHTYVDYDNRNAKNWRPIIDADRRDQGIVLDDLRYKVVDGEIKRQSRTGEPLINADSRIRIKHHDASKQAVIDELYRVLKS